MKPEHAPGLLEAAEAHIKARDALEVANCATLSLHDQRFAAVAETLERLRAAIAKARAHG